MESLEGVLRELVEHFGMRCERLDHSDASRMLMTLREEDIGEWWREKLGE